jgi:hypothetical protein
VPNVVVGNWPCAICVVGGKVFVTNQLSGSVSILYDTSNIQNFALSPTFDFSSYPNPFNPECFIPISAKCKIYNILGQLVREIEISNPKSQITKSVYWDGRDSQGLEIPNGIYFYEVAGERVRRMVVLK